MILTQDIHQNVTDMAEELIKLRRDFHKYPEPGWTEFRTASIVAERLTALGYEVKLGDAVIKEEAMMGVPDASVLLKCRKQAEKQGGSAFYLDQMVGGKTGVVGILNTGKTGPTVALRFDMDANDVVEDEAMSHRPCREGFRSVHDGAMHACGHDGHTTIGLGLAKLLMMLRHELSGTVKLVFQPAEEGVRGARAMVESGIVDDVDYAIGLHIGTAANQTGQFVCNAGGFLATTKLDACFHGKPAHAGFAPQEGRNALLAAATASLHLHGISRHGAGMTRVNVGILQAGTGRNVIPQDALLKLETRGEDSELNEYMQQEATRIIQSSANMYGVETQITKMGAALGGHGNEKLASILKSVAESSGLFSQVVTQVNMGGSDDFTFFMNRVQQRGGQSVYALLGADLAAGHHNGSFDFDESILAKGVEVLARSILALGKE